MSLSINKTHKALFFGDRKNKKANDMIVIHSTGSNNVEGTIAWFQSDKNTAKSSAHYVVARDGVIYQMVEEEDIAYHAGKSEWIVDDKLRIDLNQYSIGIEVCADQESSYTPLQYETLVELTNDIMQRRNIKEENVVRHSDISPRRKTDPYPPNMDWKLFKSRIIQSHELPPIMPHWSEPFMAFALDHKWIKEKKNPDKPVTWGELSVVIKRLYEDVKNIP